jgi:UDP-N-acetyl-D-mannosaminuronate dehydrogenase
MQLGMIGLGRMGANLVRRLMRDGHECVVHDLDETAVERLEGEGAVGARSLEELWPPCAPRGRFGSWCLRRSSTSPSTRWHRFWRQETS